MDVNMLPQKISPLKNMNLDLDNIYIDGWE